MAEAAGPGRAALAVRLRRRWRAVLRSLHRDIGYVLVGLTFVYAASGLAINHIDDWNPNFVDQQSTITLDAPLPADTDAAVAVILQKLGIDERPESVDDFGSQLELGFGANRTVRADREAGKIFDDHQEPRFFLRVANWLHYNRGKAAWTYIADGYAVLLLFLALSGTVMLKGRKGFVGRGAILIGLGLLIPVAYVHFSGGP